ncbi:prepilin-type N-terminal cleavage/methylation domain-containing protein [Granulicatella balaenopterae]|uniref:Prepilin-type N-terminal cleavage/methylation domain-containing protein n=2 Tax=Granulicatella balaenopterae TaxID=137733 RepID=A0A1H9KSG0_9LACT|nr:prepilin-type N-terminal cleavage/methylation domain-containing protein [Granulicatella balaenopterae]
MKIFDSNRRKKGYSLAELLTVIAIVGILCAITVVGVGGYYKHLKQLEMDQTAKEIYIAAQNHLTYAEANGELAELDTTTLGEQLPSKPYDMDDADWHEGDYYYLVYSPANKDTLDNTILKEMLPMGAIDGVAREAGSYIIEYNVKNASVYAVFYTEKGQENELTATDETGRFLPGDGYRGSPKDRMKAQKKSGKKFPLGYYGGSAVSGAPVEKIDTPTINVLNGDKLIVKVTDTNKIKTNISLEVTGETSHAKKIIPLNEKNAKKEQGKKIYTVILDDITIKDKHFAQLFAETATGKKDGFTPGEDITITVKAVGKEVLTPIVKTKPVTTNSLFHSVTTTTDKDGNTIIMANVSSIRHLENLDPTISGMAEDAITDASQLASTQVECAEGMGLDMTSFEQDEQLDYRIFEAVAKESDSSFTIYKADGTPATQDSYYSITNNHLTSYNGNKFQIKNLTITDQANAGMFGELTLDSSLLMSNLQLKNPSINGQETSGGFVAKTSGSLEIKYSSVEADDTKTSQESYITTKAQAAKHSVAGGMVGLVSGENNLTIEDSFVKGKNMTVTVTGTHPAVGGLVGAVSAGKLTVKDSYSNALVTIEAKQSDSSGIESFAGGLIGQIIQTQQDSLIENCYVAGRTINGGKYAETASNITANVTNGKTTNIGGFIGTVNSPQVVAINNCYTTASVSATGNGQQNIGGLIGQAKNIQVDNSYATGLVKANKSNDNAGTFIGKVDQNVSSLNKNNYVLSGINSSEVQIVGNDKDATIATKASTDIIGAKKTYTAHPYDEDLKDPSQQTGTFPLRPVIDETHYGDWPIPDITCETSLVYYETFDNQTYYFEGNFDKDNPTEKQTYSWDGTTLTQNVAFDTTPGKYLVDSGYALVLIGNLDQVTITFDNSTTLTGKQAFDTNLGAIANTNLSAGVKKALNITEEYQLYHLDGMPSAKNTYHSNWFKDTIYPLLTSNPNSLTVTIESNGTFSAKYGYIPYLAHTAQVVGESESPNLGTEFEVRSLNQYEAMQQVSHQDRAVMANKDVTIHQMLDVDFGLRDYNYTESSLLKTVACVIDGSHSGSVSTSTNKADHYWIKGLDKQTYADNNTGKISNFNFEYQLTPNEQAAAKVRRVANASAGIIDSVEIDCLGTQEVHLYNAIANINSGTITNCQASNFTTKFADGAHIGGLVGHSSGSEIARCRVSNIRIENPTNAIYVGGLVGLTNAGTISDNTVSDITMDNITATYVGGLSGQTLSNVSGCSVANTTMNNIQSTGQLYLGGLIGQASIVVTHSTVSDVMMSQVTNALCVGGLIGQSQSSVTNCNVTHLQTDVASTVGGLVHTSHNGGSIAGCTVENSTINHQTITPRSMPEMTTFMVEKEFQKFADLPFISNNQTENKLAVFKTKEVATFATDARKGTINNLMAVRTSIVQAAGLVFTNNGPINQSQVVDCPAIGKDGTTNAGFVFTNNGEITSCSVTSNGTQPTQIFGDGFANINSWIGKISASKVERIGYANPNDISISNSGFIFTNGGIIDNSHVIDCPIIGTSGASNAGFVTYNQKIISASSVEATGHITTKINGDGFVFSNQPNAQIIDSFVHKIGYGFATSPSISGNGFASWNDHATITNAQVTDCPTIAKNGFIFKNVGTITNPFVKNSHITEAGLVAINDGVVNSNNHHNIALIHCTIDGPGAVMVNNHEVSDIDIVNSQIASTGFVTKNYGDISGCQLYSDRSKYEQYLKQYVNVTNYQWGNDALVQSMMYRPGTIFEGYQFVTNNKITREEVTQQAIEELIGEHGNLYLLVTIGKKSDGQLSDEVAGFAQQNNHKIVRSSVTANFNAANIDRWHKGDVAGFVMNNYSYIDSCYVNYTADIKNELETFSGFAKVHSDGAKDTRNEHIIKNSFAIGDSYVNAKQISGFINSINYFNYDQYSLLVERNYAAVRNKNNYISFYNHTNLKLKDCFSVANQGSQTTLDGNGVTSGSSHQIVQKMKEVVNPDGTPAWNDYKQSMVYPYSDVLKGVDYPYGYFVSQQPDHTLLPQLPLYGDYYVNNLELYGKNVFVYDINVTISSFKEAIEMGRNKVYLSGMKVAYFDNNGSLQTKELKNIGYFVDIVDNIAWNTRLRLNLNDLNQEFNCNFGTIAKKYHKGWINYNDKGNSYDTFELFARYVRAFGAFISVYHENDVVKPTVASVYDNVLKKELFTNNIFLKPIDGFNLNKAGNTITNVRYFPDHTPLKNVQFKINKTQAGNITTCTIKPIGDYTFDQSVVDHITVDGHPIDSKAIDVDYEYNPSNKKVVATLTVRFDASQIRGARSVLLVQPNSLLEEVDDASSSDSRSVEDSTTEPIHEEDNHSVNKPNNKPIAPAEADSDSSSQKPSEPTKPEENLNEESSAKSQTVHSNEASSSQESSSGEATSSHEAVSKLEH